VSVTDGFPFRLMYRGRYRLSFRNREAAERFARKHYDDRIEHCRIANIRGGPRMRIRDLVCPF
jgi:hypothetical protein